MDRVRRLVHVRGVRRGLLLARYDVHELPGQLGLARWQLRRQLLVQPGLCDVGLGQLAEVLVRAWNVPQRDDFELHGLPRRLILIDPERGIMHTVCHQYVLVLSKLHELRDVRQRHCSVCCWFDVVHILRGQLLLQLKV